MRWTYMFALMGFLAALPSSIAAQDLPHGEWGVVMMQPNGNRQNLRLVVEEVPDPHARWREGARILTATLIAPGRSDRVTEIRMEGDALSFLVPTRGNMRCTELPRQEDGMFTGDCQMADGRVFRWTLTPPAE